MDTIFVLSPAFCYYKNQDGSYDFQQENTERLLAQITPDPHSTAELAQGFFCLKTPAVCSSNTACQSARPLQAGAPTIAISYKVGVTGYKLVYNS